ncbi:conserved hypothetical protein, partial [Burkholderia pseudomallei 1710a]
RGACASSAARLCFGASTRRSRASSRFAMTPSSSTPARWKMPSTSPIDSSAAPSARASARSAATARTPRGARSALRHSAMSRCGGTCCSSISQSTSARPTPPAAPVTRYGPPAAPSVPSGSAGAACGIRRGANIRP